jgi:hypothetical protein
MVTLIKSGSSGSAEHESFFHRLVLFCASEQSSTRNTNVEEWGIVGPAVESSGCGVLADTREVILEESLDFCATSGTTYVKCAAIAIVDGIDVVWRRDLTIVRLPEE